MQIIIIAQKIGLSAGFELAPSWYVAKRSTSMLPGYDHFREQLHPL